MITGTLKHFIRSRRQSIVKGGSLGDHLKGEGLESQNPYQEKREAALPFAGGGVWRRVRKKKSIGIEGVAGKSFRS